MMDVVRMSFSRIQLGEKATDFTFNNYLLLFHSDEVFRVTLIFVGWSIVLQLSLGFLFAVLIDEGKKLKVPGTLLARSAVLIGWAMPGVVIGVIWKLLLDESKVGILSFLLSQIGIYNVAFLSIPGMALTWTIIANTWRGTAFSMTLQFAALQTVPQERIEAAIVDGAGYIARIFYIILPHLRPILLINLVLVSIATFNTFDMIVPLTGGGPGRSTEVIAISIYNTIFREFNLGKGSALAFFLLVLNIILTIFYFVLISSHKLDE